MKGVALRVLGPVVADVDGDEVTFSGPRQRAVLACLVMEHGSVVSPTTLIDRLWPDAPPPTATKLIQKYVSSLRSALGARAIETTGGGYRLAVDPDDIDVVRFERSVTDGRFVDSADPGDHLVWRGPPYSGCGEPDFIVRERERLERVRLEVQLDRLSIDVEAGSFGPTLAELERLSVAHPAHERIAALLMRGLYASDRHVDALRAFRRHERYLREELGVDPSPDLTALEARILRHDESLRIARAAPIGLVDAGPNDEIDASSATKATAGAVEEVRHVVLVLARPTSAELGPDDMRVRHDSFAATVTELADRWHGHVEPTSGGDVIAVFGVLAHDDDLDRAAALGRAIVRAWPDATVGVVAGDAVVTVEPDVALVAGSVIERARALMAEAAPGQVVTDDSLARAPVPARRGVLPSCGLPRSSGKRRNNTTNGPLLE